MYKIFKDFFNNLGLLLAIIGLILAVFCLIEPDIDSKKLIILYTTLFLFLSALIQGEQFFIGLQGVALVSATMIFNGLDKGYSLITFTVLVFIFAIIYFSRYELNIARICAFIGLVALCLGVLLNRSEPIIIYGIFLALYAVSSIRQGYSIGWVFLILNIFFALVAANTLYDFF